MKKRKFILFIIITVLFTSGIFSETKKKPIVQLNHEFYVNLSKSRPLERDILLDELLNAVVQGVGYVETIDKIERYHRQIRISLIDNEAVDLNIRIYIFADNEGYLTLLKKGDAFDFRGQFVIYTPLSSRRDSYIFDIILEDGALSVK